MVSRVKGCNSPLLEGLPDEFQMWMSHGDKLHKVPDGFKAVGKHFTDISVMNIYILKTRSRDGQ